MADKWLVDILASELIPAFVEQGFLLVPLSGEDASSKEMLSAFPFGRLRRNSAYGLQIVEIQIDKYGREAFRVNAGTSPLPGIQSSSVFIPAEDVWVHYLEESFEAYQRPFFRTWFTVCKPSSNKNNRFPMNPRDLVFEIEEALNSGKCGPHLRKRRA